MGKTNDYVAQARVEKTRDPPRRGIREGRGVCLNGVGKKPLWRGGNSMCGKQRRGQGGRGRAPIKKGEKVRRLGAPCGGIDPGEHRTVAPREKVRVWGGKGRAGADPRRNRRSQARKASHR